MYAANYQEVATMAYVHIAIRRPLRNSVREPELNRATSQRSLTRCDETDKALQIERCSFCQARQNSFAFFGLPLDRPCIACERLRMPTIHIDACRTEIYRSGARESLQQPNAETDAACHEDTREVGSARTLDPNKDEWGNQLEED
jgi:hypothetical protein